MTSQAEGRIGLKMLEKGMLRATFEPQRNEIIGGWRKCHLGELHTLYS
jgi:hypothetical protein